ncbi:MAG: hypothetical protein NZ891_05225, partial [bacterium]|nr:hypothetical protein [bacterium]MDW8164126.1 hypothetical protein [Candidatus Omnitrophota bacterium]
VFAITLSENTVFFPKGLVSFGIPDNWGMTSIISGIIEGLCGIKDRYKLFEKVEISPKWESIKEKEAEVFIKYEASDAYIAYKYKREKEKIIIDFEGSGSEFYFHVYLSNDKKCKKVLYNGASIKFKNVNVENSNYVDFKIKNINGGKVEILF